MLSINQNETTEKLERLSEGKNILTTQRIHEIAKQCGVMDQRRRKLPIEVFFWLMIVAVGSGGKIQLKGIGQIFHTARLLAGVAAEAAGISKEAISEHLSNCSWLFFKAVFDDLCLEIGQHSKIIWKEMRVFLVDATAFQVAMRLIGQFPGNRTRKREFWAGVKLHFRYELFHGLPEVIALTAQIRNDVTVNFLLPIGQPVLYMFDLGYWKYATFKQIIERGQHFITRCKSVVNPLILAVYQGDPNWVGKRYKTIDLSGQSIDILVQLGKKNNPKRQLVHPVRLVGFWNPTHQRWQLYITSLLDPSAFPVDLLVHLYRLRWQIEIFFRNLKYVLHICQFVSTSENGIRIQIYAALIFYVLTNLSIYEAARSSGRPPSHFSFPYCAKLVHLYLSLAFYGLLSVSQLLSQVLISLLSYGGLRPKRVAKPPKIELGGLS